MTPRPRWTDDQLIAAVAEASTIADICRALGIVACGGSYDVIRHHAGRLGLERPKVARHPTTSDPAELSRRLVARLGGDRIVEAVRSSTSLTELCRQLGVSRSMWAFVRMAIVEAGADASHVVSATDAPGVFRHPGRSLDEILRRGVRYSTRNLRDRLLREGVKEHRCEICGRAEWADEPIPLELDHVNGDRWDNRLENLRIICPNCHALTPTYRGRNIGRRPGGGTGQTQLP